MVGLLKMPLVKILLFLLILAYFARANFIEKTSENYGPYTVEWEQYDTCRGPKLVNLTTYTTKLIKESSIYKGAVNITFLDQTRIDEVKTSVFTINKNRKVPLWSYMVNKPCQHYAISKVIETKLNAQNCVVKKGTYFFELNFTEISRNYLGSSFFYGEYVFKVIVLSKKGNIVCLKFNPIFKKKT